MISYSKRDSYWLFAILVVVSLLASILLSPLVSIQSGSTVWFWVAQSLYSLAIGATAFLYSKRNSIGFVQATKLDRKPSAKHFLLGALFVVFLVAFSAPANSLINDFFKNIGLNDLEESSGLPPLTKSEILPYVICACILPALTEEIAFRGAIGSGLTNGNGNAKSILLGGLLFSLFHMNALQTLHQFVLGCFFVIVFVRSQSLWTTVLLHLFNNLLAVLTELFVGDEIFDKYFWIMMIVGLLGALATGWLYLKLTKCEVNTSEQEKPELPCKTAFWGAIVVCVVIWVGKLVL